MKVFIGGSIGISNLDNNILNKLDNIMKKGYTILIGDAYGTDLLVQGYLDMCKYPNVKVYTSNGKVRHNLGRWEVISIFVNNSITGRDFYTAKDVAMTKDCDIGFMIYDMKSKGTRANIEKLNLMKKQVVVYNNNLQSFSLL